MSNTVTKRHAPLALAANALVFLPVLLCASLLPCVHPCYPVCLTVTLSPTPCTGVVSLTVSQTEDARTVYTARRKKNGEDRNVMDSCSDTSRHGLRLVTRSLPANKAEREEQDTNGMNGKFGDM